MLKPVSTFALAGLFLTAQLAAFEHRLEVQHAACAEHGEQIHATGASASENSVTQGALSDEGHDHCNAFLARREELAVVPVAPFALPEGPVVERAAVSDDAAVPQSPVAVLRLAPKGSPPAQG